LLESLGVLAAVRAESARGAADALLEEVDLGELDEEVPPEAAREERARALPALLVVSVLDLIEERLEALAGLGGKGPLHHLGVARGRHVDAARRPVAVEDGSREHGLDAVRAVREE